MIGIVIGRSPYGNLAHNIGWSESLSEDPLTGTWPTISDDRNCYRKIPSRELGPQYRMIGIVIGRSLHGNLVHNIGWSESLSEDALTGTWPTISDDWNVIERSPHGNLAHNIGWSESLSEDPLTGTWPTIPDDRNPYRKIPSRELGPQYRMIGMLSKDPLTGTWPTISDDRNRYRKIPSRELGPQLLDSLWNGIYPISRNCETVQDIKCGSVKHKCSQFRFAEQNRKWTAENNEHEWEWMCGKKSLENSDTQQFLVNYVCLSKSKLIWGI